MMNKKFGSKIIVRDQFSYYHNKSGTISLVEYPFFRIDLNNGYVTWLHDTQIILVDVVNRYSHTERCANGEATWIDDCYTLSGEAKFKNI